jgi:hypothetical protein
MSTFETKQLDNFVFDELIDPREQASAKTPFLRKNIVYQVDSQNGAGAYTSPDVIIDTQAIASSGNLLNWRDAYIAVPLETKYAVTLAGSGGAITAGSVGLVKKALGVKNMSFLHSLKVEANGKVIITANEGLEELVNIKALCTWNTEMVRKNGSTVFFAPDSQGTLGFTSNNFNIANDVKYSTTNIAGAISAVNEGLIKRQNDFLPQVDTSTFMSSANIKEEGLAYDSATTAFDQTVTTAQTISDIHYVGIIRLRDISDIFDKHVLSRGVSYRLTLRFNQCVSTWSNTGLLLGTGVVSGVPTTGAVQPAVCAVGAGTIAGGLNWSNSVAVSHTLTHKIDTSTDARFNGVRIYVESFEPAPEALEEILSKEPVERWFNDYLYTATPTSVGAGLMATIQLTTSCTNPRAVVLIPRVASTATGISNPNYVSPFCMSPGSTDSFLSLTNMQVKVGSTYVLPDRVYYTYQAFLDNIRSVFSVDGGNSTLQTGLIGKKDFETNHRFYVFDVSRFPESMTDLPQMISIEAKNNTQVAIEMDALVIYGRRAEWNNAQGSMTITA